MKIKPEQADRLAGELLKSLRAKELIVLKKPEGEIKAKIKDALLKNFHEEEVLEDEARAMLASHSGQMKQAGEEMDHYKMFLLIKQRLAQKKGFVL
ncbi:MAG TPA: DUF507 family protein [Candidatus Binatia bacterium]